MLSQEKNKNLNSLPQSLDFHLNMDTSYKSLP